MNGHKIVNQNHIHFITTTVVGWIDVFSRQVYRDIVIECLQFCRENKGLNLHAYVIMTNHIHLVVSAKDGFYLSDILRDFKKYTANQIIKTIQDTPEESRSVWMLKLFEYFAKYNNNNKNFQFWRKDNYPIELVSDEWIGRRIDYTHNNPVNAGFVDNAADYIYSSARNYQGLPGVIEVDKLELW